MLFMSDTASRARPQLWPQNAATNGSTKRCTTQHEPQLAVLDSCSLIAIAVPYDPKDTSRTHYMHIFMSNQLDYTKNYIKKEKTIVVCSHTLIHKLDSCTRPNHQNNFTLMHTHTHTHTHQHTHIIYIYIN